MHIMEGWKNKKVVYFQWKEYYGFCPVKTGVVLEETDTECLLKIGFKKIWTFKFNSEKLKTAEQISGYCKLIK